MSTYAADFAEAAHGLELTEDDLLANRAGLLSPSQRESLDRERRSFLGAAACVASLTALAVFELSLGRLGSATLTLLGIGVATLFLLLARESLRARRAVFPSVFCARGNLEMRESSGFSQEILVGDIPFLVASHVAGQLQPGAEYELYYVGETRTLLGWRQAAKRISTCD